MTRGVRLPEPGTLALLIAVLKGVPRLDGAACTRKAGVFTDPRRIGEAKAICTYCTALADCAAWASQTAGLVGVVAGELRGVVRSDDEQDETERGARQ